MRRLLFIPIATSMLLAAPQEDPVVKARQERAAAQGINERDLPPVPKAIVEPPALPPPETHPKDQPGYHSRHGRKGHRGSKKGGAHSSGKAPKRAKKHK